MKYAVCLILIFATLSLWSEANESGEYLIDPADSTETSIADSAAVAVTEYYAADQSVFVLPTAYTMPKGSDAVTDYELFILQITHAVSDRVHLSAGLLFPKYYNSITLGGKVNYYRSKNMAGALYGSVSPFIGTGIVGNVFSLGQPANSIHLATQVFWQPLKENQVFMLGVGGIASFSQRLSGLVELEVLTAGKIQDFETKNYASVLTFGIRVRGKNLRWDLGFVRLLYTDLGGLLFLPLIKATYVF